MTNTNGLVQYYAANGHKMEYHEDPKRPGQPEPGYAHAAWCADDCGACEEGYDLPDW